MRFGLLCCALAFLAAPAPAQTFVDAERAGLVALLPPPPPDDSLAGRADLEAVLLVQAIRTPAQTQAAATDADLGPLEWAEAVLGPDYPRARFPEHYALFELARADMTRTVDLVKAKGHQRARPAVRDRRVRPSLPVEGHGANSWPSGRAAASRVWAGILSDLFPARAEALAEAARRTGDHRVLGGVHYPTDLVAGHLLADGFLRQLRASAAYRAAVARLAAP